MSGVFILQIFAYLFIFIIILIILILVIPFQLSFLISVDGTLIEIDANFRIIYGLLKGQIFTDTEVTYFKILIFNIPIYTSPEKKEKKEEKEKLKDEKTVKPKVSRESVRLVKGLQQPITKLAKAIFRHTHVRELDAHIEAGFPDPYETSMLCALIYPLQATIYPFIPTGNFTLTPVFTKEMFKASLKGRLHLRIAMILIPLLRLFTKQEFRMLRKS